MNTVIVERCWVARSARSIEARMSAGTLERSPMIRTRHPRRWTRLSGSAMSSSAVRMTSMRAAISSFDRLKLSIDSE